MAKEQQLVSTQLFAVASDPLRARVVPAPEKLISIADAAGFDAHAKRLIMAAFNMAVQVAHGANMHPADESRMDTD